MGTNRRHRSTTARIPSSWSASLGSPPIRLPSSYQLQCIARVAHGKYYDADSAGKLAAALGEAAKAEAPPPPPVQRKTTTIVVTKPKPGKLAMTNANIMGHAVTDAKTGKSFRSLSPMRSVMEVPASFYNVKLGNAVWKSIEVKPGETTTIEPGVLEIKNASVSGHKVLDNETGEVIGGIVSSNPRMTVMPSIFAVTFGKAVWRDIEVKAGEHKVLNPGTITVNGASVTGTPIRSEGGAIVASVSPLGSWAPLPPGKYVVDLGSQKVPIDLAEGQDAVIDVK